MTTVESDDALNLTTLPTMKEMLMHLEHALFSQYLMSHDPNQSLGGIVSMELDDYLLETCPRWT